MNQPSKVKFTCANCGQKAWANHCADLICGNCIDHNNPGVVTYRHMIEEVKNDPQKTE